MHSTIRMKITKCTFNNHTYWVTVDSMIKDEKTVFIAYVNNQPPSALLYGESVKTPQQEIMTFDTELSALINAKIIKESELGNRF